MQLRQETVSYAEQLATFCKTGSCKVIPGTMEDRLPVYRELIYNVFDNTLQNTYPVTYKDLDQEQWKQLVSDFIEKHDAPSPQLWKMPEGFFHFAKENDYATTFSRPYLNDLMWFEWVEVEVFMMPDKKAAPVSMQGDLLESKLVVNPEHRLLALEYPVFKCTGAELSEHLGEYYLLSYRHPETLRVMFIELSAFYYTLMLILREAPISLDLALEEITKTSEIQKGKELLEQSQQFIQTMCAERAVLGFHKENTQ